MADWTSSMQQTYEYYIVDPESWKDTKKLDTVTSCSITRDSDTETLGSATISVTEVLGECYIRVYLITIQNGVREKHPLGTFIVQTPSSNFNGMIRDVTMDAYTPLIELKEKKPPIGYSLIVNDKKKRNNKILSLAHDITIENLRAPVVETDDDTELSNHFISETDDTWLSFLTDLIANAKYTFALDEMGRILFSPKQDTASLQPVWTYTDDNSSILYPDISMDHDLYGIPNVVEVVYSYGAASYSTRVVNDDPNSPTSTVNRGREIIYRDTDPNVMGSAEDATVKAQVDEYAKQLLRDLSSIEYTISYTHGYCPVRIGDCVRLDCEKAGLTDIKAKVVSQSIKCEPGCPVTEKAVFTSKLWG